MTKKKKKRLIITCIIILIFFTASIYIIVSNNIGDGTQKNVTVETGISNDAYIEIKSGITEKTQVVMSETTSSSNSSSRGFNFEGFPGGSGSRSGGSSSGGMQMPSGGSFPSMPGM